MFSRVYFGTAFRPPGLYVATISIGGVVGTLSTRKMLPDKPDNFFTQPDDLADVV